MTPLTSYVPIIARKHKCMLINSLIT